jgi:putative ABC transport system ATP-binding protein
VIRARDVHKTYSDAGSNMVVLQGLSLDVAPGEFVAIVGPSGSGKSSLLHILGGLDEHFTGDIEVAGQKLRGASEKTVAAFRNTSVGFVFQSFHLIPNLSALENVLLPAYFGEHSPRHQDRQRAQEVLERVGLGQKLERAPSKLSGGERQRVAIARAIFSRPKVLFCDEPTGNLDSVTGQEIIGLFHTLHQEGLTLLAVTHEERMSAAAGRVLRLKEGKLVPA